MYNIFPLFVSYSFHGTCHWNGLQFLSVQWIQILWRYLVEHILNGLKSQLPIQANFSSVTSEFFCIIKCPQDTSSSCDIKCLQSQLLSWQGTMYCLNWRANSFIWGLMIDISLLSWFPAYMACCFLFHCKTKSIRPTIHQLLTANIILKSNYGIFSIQMENY